MQVVTRKLNIKDEPVITDYTRKLKMILGERILEMVLFGSRARGDSQEGSDYDFLLLVNEDSPDVRDAVLTAEADLMDEYQALVGTIISTPEKWNRQKNLPLGINILREGVAV